MRQKSGCLIELRGDQFSKSSIDGIFVHLIPRKQLLPLKLMV